MDLSAGCCRQETAAPESPTVLEVVAKVHLSAFNADDPPSDEAKVVLVVLGNEGQEPPDRGGVLLDVRKEVQHRL